ncbi:thioredoxin TrxC [Azospirillum sp. A39]|uniref:thioredoxin TrxC n=1 Tax=Azospirillum sp. A39 TaxID=3462279 RepID=UPI004045FDED
MHVVCPHCDTVNRLPPDKPALAGKCGHCHAALFEGEPLPLTTERFLRHAEKGDLPLLVDFWAEWCGPCRVMAPAFAHAARALEPHVRLVKIDTDREQALAGRFQIRSIPTLVLLRGGHEVARTSGAMPAAALVGWARQHLGP